MKFNGRQPNIYRKVIYKKLVCDTITCSVFKDAFTPRITITIRIKM